MSRLCIESLAWWRRLEEASGTVLLIPQPMIVFGARNARASALWNDPGDANWAQESYDTLRGLGLPSELLPKSELLDRYPLIVDDPSYDHAIVDSSAGYFNAAEAVRTVARLAVELGVDIREQAPVDGVLRHKGDIVGISSGGESIEPRESVIFAGGAGNIALIPELEPKVRVTRQQIARFTPATDEGAAFEGLPTVVSLKERRYVYPIGGTELAIADDDNRKPAVTPDQLPMHPEIDAEFIRASEQFARQVLRRLPILRVLDAKQCMYSNTATQEYLIDRLGKAVIVSACSGHGFKNGPMIGQIAARLAIGDHDARGYCPFGFDEVGDFPANSQID